MSPFIYSHKGGLWMKFLKFHWINARQRRGHFLVNSLIYEFDRWQSNLSSLRGSRKIVNCTSGFTRKRRMSSFVWFTVATTLSTPVTNWFFFYSMQLSRIHQTNGHVTHCLFNYCEWGACTIEGNAIDYECVTALRSLCNGVSHFHSGSTDDTSSCWKTSALPRDGCFEISNDHVVWAVL